MTKPLKLKKNKKTLEIETPRWAVPHLKPARYKGAKGGRDCVHPDTMIDTPLGKRKISEFNGGPVYSWDGKKVVIAHGERPKEYTEEILYRVLLEDGGKIICTDQHRFLSQDGWVMLSCLSVGSAVLSLSKITSCDPPVKFNPSAGLSKVKSICKHSRQKYWDLHVPGTNCYFAEGILNHNSGKSHFFAEMLVDDLLRLPYDAVCIREYQSSLKYSSKKLIETKIQKFGLGSRFRVLGDRIITPHGKVIIFTGMQEHNSESIKSLEGFKRFWVEEARSLSKQSLELLRPTARGEDVELWFSWNPKHETDPVEQLFKDTANLPGGGVLTENTYLDNPWVTEDQIKEAEYDRARDPEKYLHVWGGGYLRNSEARVFKNWTVEEFETPDDVTHRLGADWGFSIDPTVLVRCHTIGRKLFVDYEAHEIGCEIENIPLLFQQIPDSEKWPIVADGARPETISYVKRHGYPKIYSAVKGKGSVEDGIEWLKNFDIIVHPRCKHTIDELTMYSYKTDAASGNVLPILAEKKNHVIDSLRYANEGARRSHRTSKAIDFDSEF